MLQMGDQSCSPSSPYRYYLYGWLIDPALIHVQDDNLKGKMLNLFTGGDSYLMAHLFPKDKKRVWVFGFLQKNPFLGGGSDKQVLGRRSQLHIKKRHSRDHNWPTVYDDRDILTNSAGSTQSQFCLRMMKRHSTYLKATVENLMGICMDGIRKLHVVYKPHSWSPTIG